MFFYKCKWIRNRLVESIIFCFLILAWSVSVSAEENTVVIAASDFQAPFPKGDGIDQIMARGDAAADHVNRILERIKTDYPVADGFLFAGDYDVTYPTTEEGLGIMQGKLRGTIESQYAFSQEIFAQGNHEELIIPGIGNDLSVSGAHDTDAYGVFLINEADYGWRDTTGEGMICQTAGNLKNYLDEKKAASYRKPIFVVSHVPLHFSLRTQQGDGRFAKYLFDQLQEGGQAGLNIVFLYGHNHSQGWDNYLGGSAILLKPYDCINIARPGCYNEYDTYRLRFVYMNAGYVGYFTESTTAKAGWDEERQRFHVDTGVDCKLTMTVFDFDEEEMKILRYDQDGLHPLKSAGSYNSYHDPERVLETWGADRRIYNREFIYGLNG